MRSTLTNIVLCVATAAAQEPPRRDMVRVRTALEGGAPWSGAEVVFFGPAVRAYEELASVDVVRVETDGRGRARAGLLRSRRYSVWAQSRETDGELRLSFVARDVVGGMAVRLEPDGPARTPRQVPVAHLGAWEHEAPLRYVASTILGWRQEVPLHDGHLTLAPLPGPNLLVVYGKSGRVLGKFATWDRDRTLAAVELGPPCRTHLLVVDPSGKPIPGARIFYPDNYAHGPPATSLIEIGRSDARGRAAIPVVTRWSQGKRKSGGNLIVRAPGYAEFGISIKVRELAPDVRELTDAGHPRKVVLSPGFAVRGRLHLDRERAAPGLPVLVYGSVSTSYGSMGSPEPSSAVATGADGSFVLPHRDAKRAYEIWTHLDDATLRALDVSKDFPLRPRACLCVDRYPKEGALDLGQVRLDELIPLDVEVGAADGSPGRFALVLLTMGRRHTRQVFSTDGRGRARILVPCAPHRIVAVDRRAGFAAASPGRRPPTDPVRLTMSRIGSLSGRVFTHDRKPAPGLRLELYGAELTGFVEEALHREALELQRQWVKTDAEGRFRFEAPLGFGYQIHAIRKALRKAFRIKSEDGFATELELELDAREGWRP